MPSTSPYYKYRALGNWQYLLDILLHKRLYAASFASMNDPMEGHSYYGNGQVRGDVRSAIASQREQWNICSLTPRVRSSLMWAYYADGHRGIAIGVEFQRLKSGDIRRPVDYDSTVYVRPDEAKRSLGEVATTILFRKQSLWGHEDEFRVLTRSQHVAVNIVEVHLGSLMADADRRLVRELVKLAAPTARVLKVSRSTLK
jgi:Protein of unknown function (DUF2971)